MTAAPSGTGRPVVVERPADLPDEQRGIWDELAPQAMAQGTLTPARVLAFRRLCGAIVLERQIQAQLADDGLTLVDVSVDGAGVEHQGLKAHPLLTKLQAQMVRVDTGLARFRLTGDGKPDTPTEAPKDEWSEFDAPLKLVK